MKKIIIILFLLCNPAMAGITFDKVDDGPTCGASTALLLYNSPLTISAWINPVDEGEGTIGRIISKTSGGGLSFCTQFNTNLLFTVGGATALNYSSADGTITLGTWQHVLVTWDGSVTAANVHLYVNGSEVATGTPQDGVTLADNSSFTIYLGNRSANDRTFNGQMAEVAVWNTVLSATQITQLASSRLRKIPLQVSPSSLKAYWPMDEQPTGTSFNGDIAYDLSGNGNNCTGDDGANNTGLTASSDVLNYPIGMVE